MATTSTGVKLPAGLELIFGLERENVHNPLDAVLIALHWSIVRTGLRLKSANGGEYTERLPSHWSEGTPLDGSSRHITLDYYFPEDGNVRHQVKVVELSTNNQIVVTVYRSNISETNENPTAATANGTGTANSQATQAAATNTARDRSASTFFIGDFIQTSIFQEHPLNLDRVAALFYKVSDFEQQIWNELLVPINVLVSDQPRRRGPYDDHTPAPTSSNASGSDRDQSTSSRRVRVIRDVRSPLIEDGRRPHPINPIGGIGSGIGPPAFGGPLGRSDLDPLGGIGAGMVADPRGFRNPRIGPGGLVPGQVPPGARFDPFGPPNPGRPGAGTGHWAVPNPDHERPPPGFDDMFM